MSSGTSPIPSRAPTPTSSRFNLRSNLSSFFVRTEPGAAETTRLILDSDAPSLLDPADVADSDNEGLGHLQVPHEGASLLPGGGGKAGRQQGKRDATIAVARKIKQRSKYYVPVTEWLPKYSWSLLSGDLVAGVSVACLLIPQAMSYASGLAKITPVAGLWSAAIPALVYGALGTCRQLSVGPEASLSLLIGQMVQDLVWGDPHSIPEHPEVEAAAIALITTFQIGIITSALGLLRLGFLDVVLSKALLRGFVTAVGIIIFIEQLVPMLGMAAILAHPGTSIDPPTLPISKLAFIVRHLGHANKLTAILSYTSLAVLIAARIVKQAVAKRPGGTWVRFVPEILVVVVGTTVLTSVFRWDKHGVEVLGQISGGKGLPFGWPLNKKTMKYFNYTFPTAFVSAVVGVVDSIVAARENSAKFGYAVSPNRELVALGAANLSASFLTVTGAIPVFGSLTRSRLNGQIGARTQMASIVTSLVMILSIFFLLPSFYFLPKGVLGAIITLVVFAILQEAPHDVIFYWRMQAWTDFLQMIGTFFLTLFFSIELGLVASVGFSLILVIQKSTQTGVKIIGRVPGTDKWAALDEDDDAQEEFDRVLVVRIKESLSFANTGQLKERLRRLELYGMDKSHPSDAPRRQSANAIVLHVGDVEEMDASAVQILYELASAYQERGVALHFANLRPVHDKLFHIIGLDELLGPSHFHRNLREAMRAIEDLGYGNSTISRFV